MVTSHRETPSVPLLQLTYQNTTNRNTSSSLADKHCQIQLHYEKVHKSLLDGFCSQCIKACLRLQPVREYWCRDLLHLYGARFTTTFVCDLEVQFHISIQTQIWEWVCSMPVTTTVQWLWEGDLSPLHPHLIWCVHERSPSACLHGL